MKTGGFIYAIGAVGTSYVKIGSTRTSVEHRRSVLQIGQPLPLHIIARVPVAAQVRRVESRIHAFLKADRQRGDWFDVPMDLDRLEALVLRALHYLADEDTSLPVRPRPHVPHGMADLGQRIQTVRKTRGMSQAELARRIHIGLNAMNKIESGETPDPRASRIKAIADVLRVSTDALFGREDEDSEVLPAAVDLVPA